MRSVKNALYLSIYPISEMLGSSGSIVRYAASVSNWLVLIVAEGSTPRHRELDGAQDRDQSTFLTRWCGAQVAARQWKCSP